MSQPGYSASPVSLGRILFKLRGAYSAATAYERMDAVRYGADAYVAMGATKGNLPTNAAYWYRLTDAGAALDAGLAQVNAAVAGANTAASGADAAAGRANAGALAAEIVIGGVQAAALEVAASKWKFYADGNPVTVDAAEGSGMRVTADKACTLTYGTQSVPLTANTPTAITAMGGETVLSATNSAFLSVDYNRDSMAVLGDLTVPVTDSGAVAQIDGCVGGHALDITARAVAAQAGAGDPSPENVRAIQGRSAINVWRGGRNLFSASMVLGAINNTTGAFQSSATSLRTDGHIPILPEVEYTLQNDMNYAAYRYYYRKDKSFMSYVSSGSNVPLVTFKAPKDAWFMAVRSIGTGEQNDLNARYWLSYGSAAIPYEPYNGRTYPVALPEQVYGSDSYPTTVDVINGTVDIREVGRVLTGNENWGAQGAGDTTLYYLATEGARDFVNYGRCSHFVTINAGPSSRTELLYSSGTNSTPSRILIRPDLAICPDVESFKAWLAAQLAAGTPVVCTWIQPKIITVPELTIPSLPGVNVVFTDAGGDTAVAGRRGAAWMAARMDEMQRQITLLQQLVTG